MDTFLTYSAEYLLVLPMLMLGIFFVTRRWPAQKSMAIFAMPAGAVGVCIWSARKLSLL